MDQKTFFKLLDKAFEKKKSVLLIGVHGIGKSQMTYDWAEYKAKQLNRKYIIWHQLSEEEKKKIIEEAEKYFAMIDIKLQSVGDPSKISGIPIIINHGNEPKIIWLPPLAVRFLTNPKSAGVLFLDEKNMASPSLQSLSFEIDLQRKVGEWAFSENVLIISAGNPLDVNISANPIPKPDLNRNLVIWLDVPDTDDWIRWAIRKEIDGRIISFVKLFGKEALYQHSEEELKQDTTPRSWELLSDMIKGEDDIEFIRVCAFGYLHEITANKFVAYIKSMYQLDYKRFLEDFEAFKELSPENQYAVLSLIAKHSKKIDKKKLVDFIIKLADFILEGRRLFKKKKITCR